MLVKEDHIVAQPKHEITTTTLHFMFLYF